jgi:MFS family permease
VLSEYWRVLRRNPSYGRLWLADAVSLIGDWFSLIALSVLVSRYSDGSGLAVSGLLLAQLLPGVVLGPFVGTLVDRLDRRVIMIASDLLRVAVTLGFLLVRSPDDLWIVYVLTIAQFSISSVFEPARSAIMPRVVSAGDLVTANVLSSVTWSAMLALGGLLGGVVAAYLGVTAALMLNSVSFVISALLVSSIKPINPGEGGSFRAEPRAGTTRQGGLVEGLRYLRQRPSVAALLLLKAGSAVGSIEALRVMYATTIFAGEDNGALALGLLSASAGVGAVLGPLLLERFNNGSTQRMRRLAAVGLAACALGVLGLAGAPGLLFAAIMFVGRAMGGSAVWTYSAVMLQQSTEDHVRGRVFALDYAVSQFVAVCATLTLGWLLNHSTEQILRSVTLQVGLITFIPLVIWLVALALIERSERAALPAAS